MVLSGMALFPADRKPALRPGYRNPHPPRHRPNSLTFTHQYST
jgi:hypothetical protein